MQLCDLPDKQLIQNNHNSSKYLIKSKKIKSSKYILCKNSRMKIYDWSDKQIIQVYHNT